MNEDSLQVKRRYFKAGDVIFNEGDIRENAYIIESGTVGIYNHYGEESEIRHVTLREGDLFGEMALIEPGIRSAAAVADEKCVCFVVSSNVLQDRLKGLDPVVTSLFSTLIERYRISRIESDMIHNDEVYGRSLKKPSKPSAFDSFMASRDTALKELAMEQEVRRALENHEFKPYLQPIVSLSDGLIAGFETLIRWHHPEQGLIMPDDFIPVAERMNLVQAIDREMLEMACDIIPKLHESLNGKPAPFISVNLSGVNFDDESMVTGISDVINGAGVDPKHIKLEITESAFIGNSDKAAHILDRLKQLGVTIALDDFGVGYSSLGYLHKFAIDGIKIDRSFTKRARENKKSMDIVQAIVGLAQTFDLGVIAEGIETQEDVDSLTKIGCAQGQGYLFAKPLTVEDALKKLSEQ